MGTADAEAPRPIECPPVVVDCDPGHDDMVAIVLAAHTCDVIGITTVAGNAPLARCTRNALITVEVFGLDVDVRAGADRPLVRPAPEGPGVHGPDGLGGVDIPEPSRGVADGGAVEWLLETSHQVEGLWVVATGALTNVATALAADPQMARRLAGISLMGGAVAGGNATPAAESNFWFDPHAAAVVFESGVPIRMCGLDVTRRVLVDSEHVDRIRGSGCRPAALIADVLDANLAAGAAAGARRRPLHDPCAVAALTHPELFRFEHLHVAVETEGVLTTGMSVADRRRVPRGGSEAPNADVALEVDAEGVLALVSEAIAAVGAV